MHWFGSISADTPFMIIITASWSNRSSLHAPQMPWVLMHSWPALKGSCASQKHILSWAMDLKVCVRLWGTDTVWLPELYYISHKKPSVMCARRSFLCQISGQFLIRGGLHSHCCISFFLYRMLGPRINNQHVEWFNILLQSVHVRGESTDYSGIILCDLCGLLFRNIWLRPTGTVKVTKDSPKEEGKVTNDIH